MDDGSITASEFAAMRTAVALRVGLIALGAQLLFAHAMMHHRYRYENAESLRRGTY